MSSPKTSARRIALRFSRRRRISPEQRPQLPLCCGAFFARSTTPAHPTYSGSPLQLADHRRRHVLGSIGSLFGSSIFFANRLHLVCETYQTASDLPNTNSTSSDK